MECFTASDQRVTMSGYPALLSIINGECSQDLAAAIIQEEEEIFRELQLRERLGRLLLNRSRLQQFAEEFYFIRYDFCRINFIVGARVPHHEKWWQGLAENLYEEAGGEHGVSHNELYRLFLREAGASKECDLVEPDYATRFNASWETMARNSPFEAALAAVGVYEVFDNPDYQLLFEAVQDAGVSKDGQLFFKVHAGVEHFDMFEAIVGELMEKSDERAKVYDAAAFVLDTQRQMWGDLLESLEDVQGV